MLRLRMIWTLIAVLLLGGGQALPARAKKSQDPITVMTRNPLGVFPKPARISGGEVLIGFYRPAIVVPVSLLGTPAIENFQQILKEYGLEEVPVMKAGDRLWRYDALFYIEIKYPKSPMADLLARHGERVSWKKLGTQGYAIYSFPFDPETVTPDEIFIIGNSSESLFYAAETLRQMLRRANTNRTAEDLEILIPLVQLEDQPNVSVRGLSMTIADEELLRAVFGEMAGLKLNCFVDLHTASRFDEQMKLRVRNALEHARSLGIQYIPAARGMQSDFSRAELIQVDHRVQQIAELAQIGAEQIVILENSPIETPVKGLEIGRDYNPVEQHLFFYQEALKAARRYNPQVRLSLWPTTDFGNLSGSKAPLNWQRRNEQARAEEYFKRLLREIPDDQPLVWRGPNVAPRAPARAYRRWKVQGSFGKQQLLFFDESAGWHAQLFRPYLAPSAWPRGAMSGWVLNLNGAGAQAALSLPTIYSAADFLWNGKDYRPNADYFEAILTHLAGETQLPEQQPRIVAEFLEFVRQYVIPYSTLGAPLDSEAYLRRMKDRGQLETTLADLSEKLTFFADQLGNPVFRAQVTAALRQFTGAINPSQLLQATQRGSLEEKKQALRNLSYFADPERESEIRAMTNDPNIQVQITAAGLLMYAYSNPLAAEMIERFINNPLDSVRSQAVGELVNDHQNRRITDLKKWQANPGSGTRVQIAAAFVLADRGDRKMFDFLLQCASTAQVTHEEHALAVSYLQRLTGLKTPIPYINSGGFKAPYKRAYIQRFKSRRK